MLFYEKFGLDTVRAEIEKQRSVREIETENQRRERILHEIIRWANPILAAVRGLESHLENILNHEGYVAMSKNFKDRIDPNWSISYDYFMSSSLFLFGQYFAWIQMIQEELNFELFHSQQDKDKFFDSIRKVSRCLGSFPPFYLEPDDIYYGKDTQVFNLQQRAIGELLIVRESGFRRCMGYPEFLKAMEETNFQHNIEPLKVLLDDLSPENNFRWKRVTAILHALIELREVCKKLLNLPAQPQPKTAA